jgi:hypothetical protein
LQIARHRFPDRAADPAQMRGQVEKFTLQRADGGVGLSLRSGGPGRAADLLLERAQQLKAGAQAPAVRAAELRASEQPCTDDVEERLLWGKLIGATDLVQRPRLFLRESELQRQLIGWM